MASRLFVAIAIGLFGTPCLSFGETSRPFGQVVMTVASPTETVEIYITDRCPYCARAVKFLQANQLPFVAYDIEKDREAAKRYKELSGRRVFRSPLSTGKKSTVFPSKGIRRLSASRVDREGFR